ncbi:MULTISPECIES: thioredoxin domain-containing protein [unclassified Rhizobium]|uniref:DsbA family protein n=1 Tax=unclassified Rhizobium TaxID=2613769 RepID=UPI001C83E521|nr:MULTISPECIES: thioredoxin domain-containing protein [unclassified Rhizobium]MBX5158190.1 thioredoxin domain-containing protein [Rhizobium sp. NZLR8]MBX5163500.1 thioredoxin domain-containing protein [Rhizobium sp. NZLR4b]MBX5208589.1 thioredoxin domain-containing protein [Rhizobium sp. NZLR11]
MTGAQWQADPLTWGTGPHIFEIFLEPTCPYSVRAFNKLDALLSQAGEDKVTVKIRLQSQPWHMYSGVLVRCIIAASTLEGGKDTARKVMAAIAAHREEFEFDHHAGGANMDVTPNQIIERLEGYSGVRLKDAFATPNLDREIKWHCKYARQNGIHVSPTFMIDGLVQADMSSGDEVDTWVKKVLGQ